MSIDTLRTTNGMSFPNRYRPLRSTPARQRAGDPGVVAADRSRSEPCCDWYPF